MQDHSAVLLIFVVLSTLYLTLRWFRAETHKLNHIPTVGSSGLLSSYKGALRYIRNGQDMIDQGYTQYYGSVFKVPTMSRWLVVASGPKLAEDVKKAPADQLNFRSAVAEMVQLDYMVGRPIRVDPYHVTVVKTTLTRNIGIRFSDIYDEITAAFSEFIPAREGEWMSVPVVKTTIKIICRSSNRLFIGLPLCRDPDYRRLTEEYSSHVFQGANTINMFPPFLRPLVGRYLTKVPSTIRRVKRHLGPIIQDRLAKEQQYGRDWPGKPNDYLSWLLDEAEGNQRTVHDLVTRLLAANFASIHTTSNAFTQALYDLACHPEYAEPLREEVESIVRSKGWSKESVGKMRKLDSFIKESQRVAATLMSRKVLKDFKFSNGVAVPAGTHLAVAARAMHFDEANYDNPHAFDGFRFSNMGEDGESSKHQMSALALEYLVFGNGRHACPGRFFAVSEIKAMLAYVLSTYDVKFSNDGPRPENVWFHGLCSPDGTAEVLFRKRAT